MSKVRVRFAPSPTGGLHIGGVRTALFNYLFARKNNGSFILRIEDTDQTRYVEGAEEYITNALSWCGIVADESPQKGGEFSPYRQSERKELYQEYAKKLLNEGNAYYAFDTPEELEEMRERLKEAGMANLNYNSASRMTMKNSLTLSNDDVKKRIESGEPYVVRLKVPAKEEIRLRDNIRGYVVVHSSTLDDKVILKSDGLPTYHLANVVDDHLMKISHVIRGEEWLPSAPLHVLLYRYLGWEDNMPEFAHLPLILKPDGNGKLSKRAADKAGFPIFPTNWKDPNTGEEAPGFREAGYLPEAMINFLALLGWNPGSEQEEFTISELIEAFSLERIGKAGTKFDIEKARWFNQQYIKKKPLSELGSYLKTSLEKDHGISVEEKKAEKIAELFRERVTFLDEMVKESLIFFKRPEQYDEKVVRKKWNEETADALTLFANKLGSYESVEASEAKQLFYDTMEGAGLKMGKFMQPLRLSVSGKASGPDLMSMIEIMGPGEIKDRILQACDSLH